jgi:hypothetical protein
MTTPQINAGDILTCAETGAEFVAARDGCSFNYARSHTGEILSDAGVDIRMRRDLAARKPMIVYLSGDGKSITGWKGNELGRARAIGTVRLTRMSYVFGREIWSYRVTDCHGGEWYGRGAPGIAMRIRPCKEKPTRVVFRFWRESYDVIALFPDIPETGGACMSYEHVGQHGGADYSHVVAQSRPATPEEYAPLKRELESIGYTLAVRSRR